MGLPDADIRLWNKAVWPAGAPDVPPSEGLDVYSDVSVTCNADLMPLAIVNMSRIRHVITNEWTSGLKRFQSYSLS